MDMEWLWVKLFNKNLSKHNAIQPLIVNTWVAIKDNFVRIKVTLYCATQR